MSVVVLGELLDLARDHFDACAAVTGSDLTGRSAIAAAPQAHRAVETLVRYLGDLCPADALEKIASGDLRPQAQAAVDARIALQLAAASLTEASPQPAAGEGGGAAGPLAESLADAATALAGGRDLMQTHFATDTGGQRAGRSEWSAVITSEPIAGALLEDVGRWSRQLGLLTARLSTAAAADTAIPARVTRRLVGASGWLLTASKVLEADGRTGPATEADKHQLRAIPAAIAPGRRPPSVTETVTELPGHVAESAARLRRVAHDTGGRAALSPVMTAASWRWTATGAAVICDLSEAVLTTLAQHPALPGGAPGLQSHLRDAAEAAAGACTRWRQVAAAWNQMTTETRDLTAPAVTETSDLLIRLGRLAFTDPAWAPARSGRASLRAVTDLASGARQAAMVLSAVHEAAGALELMAAADLNAVGVAASAGRIHVPTRTLPDGNDVVYRYGNATPQRTSALTAAYRTAHAATSDLVTELDSIAITMNAPSQALATARTATRTQPEPTADRPAQGRPPGAGRPGAPAGDREDVAFIHPGPVERTVRAVGAVDEVMLLRAKALDKAASTLVEQSRASVRTPIATDPPEIAGRPRPTNRNAVRAATASFPHGVVTPSAGQEANPSQARTTRSAPGSRPASARRVR